MPIGVLEVSYKRQAVQFSFLHLERSKIKACAPWCNLIYTCIRMDLCKHVLAFMHVREHLLDNLCTVEWSVKSSFTNLYLWILVSEIHYMKAQPKTMVAKVDEYTIIEASYVLFTFKSPESRKQSNKKAHARRYCFCFRTPPPITPDLLRVNLFGNLTASTGKGKNRGRIGESEISPEMVDMGFTGPILAGLWKKKI